MGYSFRVVRQGTTNADNELIHQTWTVLEQQHNWELRVPHHDIIEAAAWTVLEQHNWSLRAPQRDIIEAAAWTVLEQHNWSFTCTTSSHN